MTTEEIKDFLNDEIAEKTASDIADLIESQATNDTLEVDFKLSQGKMTGTLDTPNTWFHADTLPGTTLNEVKTFIGKVFSEDFDENDPEKKQNAEIQTELVQNFIDNVRLNLNSGIFETKIANTIRRVVFQGIPAVVVPINVLNFLDVEIGEINKNEFLIAIQKLPKVDPVSGQFISPPQSVSVDLLDTFNSTGKSFEEIIKMRKDENDPRYDAVAGVAKKRYSFDVHCRIAADYSFCDVKENVQQS
jgi:hypothetical protein